MSPRSCAKERFDTVLGTIGFDEKGDIVGPFHWVWNRWRDGAYWGGVDRAAAARGNRRKITGEPESGHSFGSMGSDPFVSGDKSGQHTVRRVTPAKVKPGVSVSDLAARPSCGKAEEVTILTPVGVHLENPGECGLPGILQSRCPSDFIRQTPVRAGDEVEGGNCHVKVDQAGCRRRTCRRRAAALLAMRGHEASAQSASLYVNALDIDIVPGEIDHYLAALKENAAAAVKQEPGCHTFDITVSQADPNHVFIFEVYDNAAALQAHRTTDHFKKGVATTKDMVAKREARALTTVAMYMKGM